MQKEKKEISDRFSFNELQIIKFLQNKKTFRTRFLGEPVRRLLGVLHN
jgi:hypothetical protein